TSCAMPAKSCGHPIAGTLAWDGGSDRLVSGIDFQSTRTRASSRRSVMQFFKMKSKGLALALTGLCILVPISMGQQETPAKSSDKNDKGRKIQKVNVVAERFNFTPSKIKVQQGTLLEITLTSDDTFHGFRIPSMQVNQLIPARGRGSVKVLFDA